MHKYELLRPVYRKLEEKNEQGENLWNVVHWKVIGETMAINDDMAIIHAKAMGVRCPILRKV